MTFFANFAFICVEQLHVTVIILTPFGEDIGTWLMGRLCWTRLYRFSTDIFITPAFSVFVHLSTCYVTWPTSKC